MAILGVMVDREKNLSYFPWSRISYCDSMRVSRQNSVNTFTKGLFFQLYIFVLCSRPGGLLVGQLNKSTFFESTGNDEYKPHALPMESKWSIY